MSDKHLYIDVSTGSDYRERTADDLPAGVYDVIKTEMRVTEDGITFVHRIGSRRPLPQKQAKIIEVKPAGERNTPGE
jgi:hypothetical protein